MANSALEEFLGGINQAQQFLNNRTPLTQSQAEQFKADGFALPATFSADGTGLPFSKVSSFRDAKLKRNTMAWFIPEFGLVRMFVNPENLTIADRKLIIRDRTKAGYTLQYYGEDLTTITLSGTTGSAGIEGINVLHEIYRAEQYAFDGIGLTLAANNVAADLSQNLISGIGGAIGGAIGNAVGGVAGQPGGAGVGAGVLGGILGLDSPNNALATRNIPSLAQLAFTVELFYNGVVYRGYFESMTVNERASSFPIEYQITFIATQKRGYRLNYFPWTHAANQGPSQFTSPYSYSGHITEG
jgi:hypothetical protein